MRSSVCTVAKVFWTCCELSTFSLTASEHLGSAIFGDLMRDYERHSRLRGDSGQQRKSNRYRYCSGSGSICKAWAWAWARTCVAVDAGVAAKDAFGSDELGQRTLDLLSSSLTAQTLKSYAGRLSQFAEFCHDSENISPLEATTASVVRLVLS
eukprot:jgi/Tetstr1/459630/TSEL_004986.t1